MEGIESSGKRSIKSDPKAFQKVSNKWRAY
jgi:hypothetical protein